MVDGVRTFMASGDCLAILPDTAESVPRRSEVSKRPAWVVVSNANGTLQAKFERLGLAPYFDALFDSHVEKVEKPDRRFFEIALERSGSERATTVHVGDFYEIDVVGARNAGLAAILYDPAGVNQDRDCDKVRSLDELATRLGA